MAARGLEGLSESDLGRTEMLGYLREVREARQRAEEERSDGPGAHACMPAMARARGPRGSLARCRQAPSLCRCCRLCYYIVAIPICCRSGVAERREYRDFSAEVGELLADPEVVAANERNLQEAREVRSHRRTCVAI